MTVTIVGGIRLASGELAIVDPEDAPLLSRFRWFALRCPHTIYARGYRIGDAGRKSRTVVVMHRLLVPVADGFEVDHWNRNGLDNRRVNLRVATRSQNNGNHRRPSRSRSGYKGVTAYKGRWCAAIWLDNKRRHLGVFDTPWEAAQAYNAAAVDQWGDFALLNERVS